jgi:tripartite ATP-independent transporter DctM subunit
VTLDPIVLGALGLAAMFVLIALHIPIGVAMGLSGGTLVAMLIGWGPALSLFSTVPSSILASSDLAVIPLFLLMGSFAGQAGLSADLYRLAHAFIGHRPGGLALATIGGCAGFGAVCGSSVATAATFARIALPEMLKRRYAPQLATGCIAAGGTLGILIPPSVIMVMYAVLTEQFVLALFVAAIIPGLLAVALHFIAIEVYVRLNPGAAPAGPRLSWRERLRVIRQCWMVLVLAVLVSGGLYTGVFTVTEAASVGAGLSFLFAIMRGRLTRAAFLDVLGETAANTGLIYVIMIGASIFTYFATLSHLPQGTIELIKSWELSPLMIMLLLTIVYLILGSVFETVAAMVITLPFVFPLVIAAGFDPVWFGIYNVMIIEIGMITPPIGVNVFVLHGMARTIPLATIFRGIMPFLCADVVRLTLLVFFPVLALWLPRALGMPM